MVKIWIDCKSVLFQSKQVVKTICFLYIAWVFSIDVFDT